MWPSTRSLAAGLVVCIAVPLTACNGAGMLSSFGDGPAALELPALELPATVDAYPDGEVLQVAKTQFAAGNFGHAARYYERAVEIAPKNPEAWLGLAASYDRVRRFDLADRAYREAGLLIGNRPEYYNNVGYSYLLRGDVAKARTNFLRAYELDPASATVNNNLELLRDGISRSKKT